MKTAIKTMMIGVAACAFAAPAFAYTISGTIPGPKWIAIHLQKPPGPGYLKLTLAAPPASISVGYSIGFCVAPASARASLPCPPNQAGFVIVPGQQTIVFISDQNIYPNDVVWLGTGVRGTVPYTLDVDYIP